MLSLECRTDVISGRRLTCGTNDPDYVRTYCRELWGTDMPASAKPDTSPLVLRTVYLPQEVDERLKRFGLLAKRSKNDLIREAVSKQLKVWEESDDVDDDRESASERLTAATERR